jgi:hypothetical protein
MSTWKEVNWEDPRHRQTPKRPPFSQHPRRAAAAATTQPPTLPCANGGKARPAPSGKPTLIIALIKWRGSQRKAPAAASATVTAPTKQGPAKAGALTRRLSPAQGRGSWGPGHSLWPPVNRSEGDPGTDQRKELGLPLHYSVASKGSPTAAAWGGL